MTYEVISVEDEPVKQKDKYEVISIEEDEVPLSKSISSIPRKVYENTALPLAENLTGQVLGGAAFAGGAANAVRNYITTLAASNSEIDKSKIPKDTLGKIAYYVNPVKAVPNYLRGLEKSGAYERARVNAEKGYNEVQDTVGALWQPRTELGKKSLEYSGKLLYPLRKSAEGWGMLAKLGAETVGLPDSIVKTIEPAVTTAVELALFGTMMKGGGIVKNKLREVIREKKGLSPEPTKATQMSDINRLSELEKAQQQLEQPFTQPQVTKDGTIYTELERPPMTPAEVDVELAKPEVKAEYERWLDEVAKKEGAEAGTEEGVLPPLEEVKPAEVGVSDMSKIDTSTEAVNTGNLTKEKFNLGLDAEARANTATSSTKLADTGGAFLEQTSQKLFKKPYNKLSGAEKQKIDKKFINFETDEISETGSKFIEKLTGESGSIELPFKAPFYSKLAQVVNQKMRMNMPVEQLRKTLYGNGVTADEFNAVLGDLKGNVTKKDVLDAVVDKGIEFKEVILGEEGRPTYYEQYSEPGSIPGSYREMFVTVTKRNNGANRIPTKEEFVEYYKNQGMGNTPSKLADLEFFYKEAVGKNEFEKGLLDSIGITTEAKWQDGHGAYSDIQNPIVRIRFNEREVNGKRILFVEEIQGPSEANQAKMPEALRERIYDIGVKRVLTYAKENGCDRVAWTTGEMQTKRYDLSKYVSYLEYSYNKDIAEGRLTGYKTSSDVGEADPEIEVYTTPDKLIDYVGIAHAKELLKTIDTTKDFSSGYIDNLNLKVGGEGLKSVYDERLPGLMKKYGKEEIKTLQLREKAVFEGSDPNKVEYQETSYIPITEKTPSTFTLYSDPCGFQASYKLLGEVVESASEGWEKVKQKYPSIDQLDENTRNRIHEIVQGIKEGVLDPERVLRNDPYTLQIFKNLANAEEMKNAFFQKVIPEFLEATKGIKKESESANKIGMALDDEIHPVSGKKYVELLNPKEKKAYDYFKKNYDWLIHEYARKAAGSESAYQEVLKAVTSRKVRGVKIRDLSPEDKAQYTELRKTARDIKGDKKYSELDEATKEAYNKAQQNARDFLHQNFSRDFTVGQKEAYDILSRKISEYLPHLFDKKQLKQMFEEDITRINRLLESTTNKSSITRYNNELASVKKALSDLEGGRYINFRDLPRNVFFRFFQERKGAKGYSYDAIKAFETYVYGIARKMYDEPALRKSYELYEKASPELKPYTEELINHYMGYGKKSHFEDLSRFTTTFEWIRTLGLNPRSALVNYTQRLNTAVWVGEKYAIKAQKMMLGSGEDRAIADQLFNESGIAREIPQVLMEGPVAPSLEGLRKITGVMFDMVEKGNRQHAFLSGYLKAIDKGMSKDAAMKEGIKTVHKTQFRYGKLGMAKWSRGAGGRVMLQFVSYPLKQAQFLYDLYRKDPLSFCRYLGYTIGGNLTLQELLDTDMSNAVGFGISLGEAMKAVEFAAEGDMRGAFRHGRQTFQPGGGLLPSGLGPVPMGVFDIGVAATKGKGLEQAVKEVTPVMYDRVKKAVRAVQESKDGEYPIFSENGRERKYNLTARQLAQTTLGPRTELERQKSLEPRDERNLEQERLEIQDEIVKLFVDYKRDKDEDKLSKIIELIDKYGEAVKPSDEAIKNEEYKREFTREERQKIGKKEKYQIMREGELIQ